ncbi:MAG: signal peptidase I [Limisphaerales bacterium]
MSEAAPPADPPPVPRRRHPFLLGRNPRWTLVRALVLVAAVVVAFKFILLPIRVSGESMAPTHRDGQVNFIHRRAYQGGHTPQRGDVVAIRTSGTRVLFLKRVIALPGEETAIVGGQVIINRRPLFEPYLNRPIEAWNLPPRELGPDEYLVIGDNRSMPQELHAFGVVRRERIVGKALR